MSISKQKFIDLSCVVIFYLIVMRYVDLSSMDDAKSYYRYFSDALKMLDNYGFRALTNDIGYLLYLHSLKIIGIPRAYILECLSVINFILIFGSFIHLLESEGTKRRFLIVALATSPVIFLALIIHFRQGFALGVFLTVLCFLKLRVSSIGSEETKLIKAAVIASFFHTSYLFLICIFLTYALSKRLFRSALLVAVCTLCVALVLSVLQNYIALYLGARQTYDRQLAAFLVNGIGFGLIFYIAIFMLVVLTQRKLLSNFIFLPTLIYIVFYLVNPLAGRFLLPLYPLIVIGSSNSINYRYYTLFFCVFNVASFNSVLEQV